MNEIMGDVFKVKQILNDVRIEEILKYLRSYVPVVPHESRSQAALKHFLAVRDAQVQITPEYSKDQLELDFICLRAVISSATSVDIRKALHIFGNIPNRREVAARLLLSGWRASDAPKKNKLCSFPHSNGTNRQPSSTIVRPPHIDINSNDDGHSQRRDSSAACNGRGYIPNYLGGEVNTNVLELRHHIDMQHKWSVFKLPQTSSDRNDQNEVHTMISDKDNTPNLASASAPNANAETNVLSLSTKLGSSSTTSESRSKSPDNGTVPCCGPPLSPCPKRSLVPKADVPQKRLCTSLNTRSNSEKNAIIGQLIQFLQEGAPQGNQEMQPVHTDPKNEIKNEEVPQDNLKWNPQKDDFMVHASAEPKQMQEVVRQNNHGALPVFKEPKNGTNREENNKLVPEPPAEQKEKDNYDNKTLCSLMEMFPEACPEYLRKLAGIHSLSVNNIDVLIGIILAEDYPRKPQRPWSPVAETDPEEILSMLKEVLPDADPTYLAQQVDRLGSNQQALERFIDGAIVHRRYPTKKEYLRKQQLSAQQRQYSTAFKVERFVELFPDPQAVFEDPNRKSTILNENDMYYITCVMKNKFSMLYAKDIQMIVNSLYKKNIGAIVKALTEFQNKGKLKKKRVSYLSKADSDNIPMLQELAYFENKEDILKYIQLKKEQVARERQNAKELNMLQTCGCCCDDEIMPNNILTCTGGCCFCCECIRRSVEIAFAEGKIDFPCLGECDKEFSLQILQKVLPPKLFSKVAQKKALAEVKAAGIEDLVGCPFCDFATIIAPEDKLFRCLNPDCMKESCRLCKEPSHVPLRCEEVEKDEAVKARTYIENKMTEALIRECWKCGKKFIKVEGCNKMTCSCGAMMCYICRKPVDGYRHFNGQGGDKYHLCPLFSDNFTVNEGNVLKAAEQAKKEINPAQLKHDPTADLKEHLKPNKTRVSVPHIRRIQAALQAGEQQLRVIENRLIQAHAHAQPRR